MTTLTLEDAQTRLTDVVRQLADGEEVMITEGNHVVARIVGESKPAWKRPEPGLAKDMFTILVEDDEHLKDFAEYMP